MKKHVSLELRVSVDVGCRSHNVAIGLSSGEVLDEFSITHEPEGFRQFFSRIEKQKRRFGCPVAVAMEGYNGYARPLDTLVRARNYRLFNINNLKLARFKEIFPGVAKTDEIDARKGLELFLTKGVRSCFLILSCFLSAYLSWSSASLDNQQFLSGCIHTSPLPPLSFYS